MKAASKACVLTSNSTRSEPLRSLHVPENLLQLYVDNSPLALIQFDVDRHVVAWSERATAMFGWTEDDVRGKKLAARIAAMPFHPHAYFRGP